VLYCFFVIGHDRRCMLHFNVTRHPSSTWIVQQLREAFPDQFLPPGCPANPDNLTAIVSRRRLK
jgi:hypothetical protein